MGGPDNGSQECDGLAMAVAVEAYIQHAKRDKFSNNPERDSFFSAKIFGPIFPPAMLFPTPLGNAGSR
jgi:hypothetical protein